MNQGDYFRNEWWDLADSFSKDKARKKQLTKEQAEVFDEMILQEYTSGKTATDLAKEYNLHVVSIYRIAKRANIRNKEMIK